MVRDQPSLHAQRAGQCVDVPRLLSKQLQEPKPDRVQEDMGVLQKLSFHRLLYHIASSAGNYFAPYKTFGARHLPLPPPFAVAFYGPLNSLRNPTKNTPSRIAFFDYGDTTVLSEESGKFIKLKLKGRKLNGLFFVAQQ